MRLDTNASSSYKYLRCAAPFCRLLSNSSLHNISLAMEHPPAGRAGSGMRDLLLLHEIPPSTYDWGSR